MKSKKFKVCVKVEASTIPVALEMEGTRGEAKEDNEHWEEMRPQSFRQGFDFVF